MVDLKKNGFISMAVIYSFIIVFLMLMVSLLGAYAYRNNLINNEVVQVKSSLNKGYE